MNEVIFLLVFCVILLLTTLNYAMHRSLLYPPVVGGAIWSLLFLDYFLFRHQLLPLTGVTLFLIMGGYLAFSMGALAGGQTRMGSPPPPHEPQNAGWLIWLPAVLIPVVIYKLWFIGATGPSDNLLFNLRYSLLFSEEEVVDAQLGALFYFTPMAMFGCALHCLDMVKSSRSQKVASITVAMTYAFLGTGRSYFLLLIVMIGSGLIIQGKVGLRRMVLLGGGVYLGLFALLGFLAPRSEGEGAGFFAESANIINHYFLAGIAGLNDFIRDPGDPTPTLYTLRAILAVLHKFDPGVRVPELVMEFRDAPFPTNVYTVFRTYYQDFGWLGVLGSQFVFGFLHSCAFHRARQRYRFWVLVYAALMYPLVVQFFQDGYMGMLSVWAQWLILFGVVWGLARFRRRQPLTC